MSLGKILILSVVSIVLILLLVFSTQMFENVDAHEIMVVQAPSSGTLTWYTTPGLKWQGFGTVTTYPLRSQISFTNPPDANGNDAAKDPAIKIRFNDGGHASIVGGISWEMPTDPESLTQLHRKYGSPASVERDLVLPIINKSVYMTGPLMSSTESYAGRRNELIQLIEDQVSNGICLTKTVQKSIPDPITGENKVTSVVELVMDKDNQVKRAEESPLKPFNVKAFNLSIKEIDYEEKVELQIQQQQDAAMKVQLAIAEAKRAEQDVLTAKKEGEANAAKAEWKQKEIAATETTKAEMLKKVAETEAQQKLAVAELDKKTAEAFKLAETARGEGEAARRHAVMEADGALDKKLESWVEVNKAYATAISQHQGAWVPAVVMGGGQPGQQTTATGPQQLIEMLSAKTAIDLGLEIQAKRPQPKPQSKPAE